eukprot:6179259-Pleurochrysis_carterae.AAC.1
MHNRRFVNDGPLRGDEGTQVVPAERGVGRLRFVRDDSGGAVGQSEAREGANMRACAQTTRGGGQRRRVERGDWGRGRFLPKRSQYKGRAVKR